MSIIKIENTTGNEFMAFDDLMIFHLEELMGENLLFPQDTRFQEFSNTYLQHLDGSPSLIVVCESALDLPKVMQYCDYYQVKYTILDDNTVFDTVIDNRLVIYYPFITLKDGPTDKLANNQKNPDIIDQLQIFVENHLGAGKWGDLLSNPDFLRLMTDYYPKYGDAIFSELVDIIVVRYNLTTKGLLKQFSAFTKS